MTCDDYRAHVLGAGIEADRPSGPAGIHLTQCAACRAWTARFREGTAASDDMLNAGWLASVVARTSGAACERAQTLVCLSADEALPPADAALVRAHVAGCARCQAFEAEWQSIAHALPTLAAIEPDPDFVAEVLAATSRRPQPTAWAARLAARVAAAWGALVSRPRLAWEVAYVCTLCWLLVFGNPIRAFDWTTARLGAVTETAVSRSASLTALRPPLPETPSWWPSFDAVSRAGARLTDTDALMASAVEARQRSSAWLVAQASGLLDGWRAIWTEVLSWFTSEPADAPVR